MKQWYFDLDEFKPMVGFEFKFIGKGQKGENYTHVCKVTEVIPNKKLQYSWEYENYEGNSLVSFELTKEEVRTRIKLTHQGLETFPQDSPDFSIESFNAGWTQLIHQSLKKFIENGS